LTEVRIPRDNLLNRFNDVARDGTYSSPLASPGERFLANMAALLGARANVGISSNNVAKIGLTIAIKYALSRRQFGGGKGRCFFFCVFFFFF
jgi:acyl-CoA oxidase